MVDVNKNDILKIRTNEVETEIRVNKILGNRVYFTDLKDTELGNNLNYYKTQTIENSNSIDLL